MTVKAHSGLSTVLVLAGLLVAGAPPPATAQMASEAAAGLEVVDLVLARGVTGREPVGVTDRFSVRDGRGFVYARVNNPGPPETLTFRWYRDWEEHAAVPLRVGRAPNWRVWSSANLAPGTWFVLVEDSRGQALVGRTFDVAGS